MKHQAAYGKAVFTFALLVFLYRFLAGALLSQMAEPVLVYPDINYFYWLFLYTGIPQYLTSHHYPATFFDLMLVILPVVFVVYNNRFIAILFWCLLTVYMLTFNCYASHHYHSLMGLWVILIPFFTKNEERFMRLWSAARYYLLFVFVSAAMWKIFRGTVFEAHHFAEVLKAQHAQLFLEKPDAIRASFVLWLIAKPGFAHFLFTVTVLLQLSFLSGFFTRKYDILLVAIGSLFFIANYLLMAVFSFELLVLFLTLLKPHQLPAFVKEEVAREG
jgi:hypothetical protein